MAIAINFLVKSCVYIYQPIYFSCMLVTCMVKILVVSSLGWHQNYAFAHDQPRNFSPETRKLVTRYTIEQD